MKSSLIASVFGKTMAGKPTSMSRYTTGEITNFMSTDVGRVVNFCPSFHQFWSLPMQVAVTLYLLYRQVCPLSFSVYLWFLVAGANNRSGLLMEGPKSASVG